MKKFLFMFALIFVLTIGLTSCSSNDDDEYPKKEQVTTKTLDNTIWYSKGVSGIIGFKSNKVAYRTYNSFGGFNSKHTGTYSVKDGILSIKLDGETEVKTFDVLFNTKSEYSERLLFISLDKEIYEDFPYGECYVEDNNQWKYLFEQ